MTLSPANEGDDDSADSDADPTTGQTGTITLTSGEDDLTNDAGYFQTASLGDFVFFDENANGLQDAGDVGIIGVVVNLLVDGEQVATTTTDENGFYQFTDLTPGEEYQVEFPSDNGLEISPQNQGDDDAVDSDADPTTGLSQIVVLESGENNPTIDAGYFELVALGDYVFFDADADGIQDPEEAPVEGAVVTLFNAAGDELATDTTDENGLYLFDDLTPGDYFVQVTTPEADFPDAPAFVFTTPNLGSDDATDSDVDENGTSDVVTLLSGADNLTVDAGITRLATALDPCNCFEITYFEDELYEFTDVIRIFGVPGQTWTLEAQTGIFELDRSLQGDGLPGGNQDLIALGTEFVEVAPGVYELEFAHETGIGYSASVGNGSETLEIGNVCEAPIIEDNISDDLRLCEFDDPIILSGTATIDGVEIEGTFTWFLVTDDGEVEITQVDPQDYEPGERIRVITQFQPAPMQTDFSCLQRYSQELNIDRDGCLAEIGDFVFLDSNADGIQDAGEAGIAAVAVTLLDENGDVAVDADGTSQTTLTDEDGRYLFDNLAPGTYIVAFGQPDGLVASPQNQGVDDATDSDADPVTGESDPVILGENESNLTVDAGFYETASLGDFVFEDTNGNGVQDDDEPGVEGVHRQPERRERRRHRFHYDGRQWQLLIR